MTWAWALLIVAYVLVRARFALRRQPESSFRLKRLEHNVEAIMKKLGLQMWGYPSERVRSLAEQGRKIDAIKAFREETGADLKESKDAVDPLDVDRLRG